MLPEAGGAAVNHFAGIDRRDLADALSFTAYNGDDDWKTLGHKAQIDLAHVLSWAWNPMRLENAKRLLAEGRRAPAVHLTRVTLGEGRNRVSYYLVSDGNHRIEAARAADRLRIYASVSGETHSRPELYRLDVARRSVWRVVGRNTYSLIRPDLTDGQMAALKAIGVKLLPSA